MDEQEAAEAFSDFYDAWEAGDHERIIEDAGAWNSYLIEQGEAPFTPDDFYPDDPEMADAMWDYVDSLSHEEREAFFGY